MTKYQVVTDKSLLLKTNNTEKYIVGVDPEDETQVMEVWIKDISFLDIQGAAQRMFNVSNKGNVELNLEGYYHYAFGNWITKTNPALTRGEIAKLKGHIGNEISKLLPKPNELMEALEGSFTKPSE